jgi:hypothetical protein
MEVRDQIIREVSGLGPHDEPHDGSCGPGEVEMWRGGAAVPAKRKVWGDPREIRESGEVLGLGPQKGSPGPVEVEMRRGGAAPPRGGSSDPPDAWPGHQPPASRGYLTKYDCSAADINPIGGISKTVGGMVNDKNLIIIWCRPYIAIVMIIGDHGSVNLYFR